MYLAAGCIMGLVLGIVPGIGGLAGTAMLLPFTFNMDPYAAFALLLGLGSTTATGDPIPAVLVRRARRCRVRGDRASTDSRWRRKGEAGRALSACYMSSMMGGIFGACLLAVSIPILRPVMLFLGSPELLAFAVLGISMVALLSGNAPLRGLAAGCLGIMIAMIGTDPQSGTLRWTFNSLYLWDGLPLTPLLLGIFALPELCDLLITRQAIAAGVNKADIYKGQWQGVKDCFQHWWLIVRCSWIGGGIGSIPGISASVVDWLAYGHALKTEKGAALTFGKGDVRGVIASESSNNAKEGGALVPTIAFGVPGSATMAILLGAFLIHGLVPGPDMLHKNLDITYSMVWSVALANILGAGMAYAFSPQFARLATLRFSLILPAVMGIIYIGAFEATRQWGDLYALLFFGLVGWCMKQFKWPRPPLILGAVLGDTIERYMFISVERYGISWFARPVVAILFIMAIIGLLRPMLQDIKSQGGVIQMTKSFQAPGSSRASCSRSSCSAILTSMVLMATAMGLQRQDRSAGRRRRRHDRVPVEPVQRHVPQAGADVVRKSGGCGPARGRAEDPHGSRVRHRASADRAHRQAGGPILRLPGRLHGRHGRHRPGADGGALRRLLHAVRKQGAVEARHHLRDRPGVFDQLRVRQRDVDPVAADTDRAVVPGLKFLPSI